MNSQAVSGCREGAGNESCSATGSCHQPVVLLPHPVSFQPKLLWRLLNHFSVGFPEGGGVSEDAQVSGVATAWFNGQWQSVGHSHQLQLQRQLSLTYADTPFISPPPADRQPPGSIPRLFWHRPEERSGPFLRSFNGPAPPPDIPNSHSQPLGGECHLWLGDAFCIRKGS